MTGFNFNCSLKVVEHDIWARKGLPEGSLLTPRLRVALGRLRVTLFFPLAVADIPGIIRGAHRNKGLGLSFLRHIERCRFFLIVVDLSLPEPWTQVDDLKYELEKYEEGLSERSHVIIANKIDLPQARARLPQLQAHLGQEVIALSALTGENLEQLLLHLKVLHDAHVEAELEQGCQPLRW